MILRTTYCCNLNPVFVAPEHHKPRPAFSQRLGKLIKKTKVVFWEGFWEPPLLKPKTLEALPPHSYISSPNGYYGFFRLKLSDLLELFPISSGFIVEKPSPLLIDPALAGKVLMLQKKIEAGIRVTDLSINAKARNPGVFFWAYPFMVAQTGHPKGGRQLMEPVTRNLFGLPPLRFESHAVAVLIHQRLPA